MTDLKLHIGHDKTGSTYIQTALSLNRDSLATHGILYPVHGADARASDPDTLTPTGNGSRLIKTPEGFEAVLAAAMRDGARTVVFSSETLFDEIVRKREIGFVAERARRLGYRSVSVLFYIRNPIGHAISQWQQAVKGRKAETRPLDEFLSDSYDQPRQVRDVTEKLEAIGVDLTVLNYDARKAHLLDDIASWIGLTEGERLVAPTLGVVNRSLTAGEAELQRALNRRIGRSGSIFAFPIVNALPSVAPQPLIPSRGAQERALARLDADIAWTNARVDAANRYRADLIDMPAISDVGFTVDQIAFIGDRLGAALAEAGVRHRTPLSERLAAGHRLLRRLLAPVLPALRR